MPATGFRPGSPRTKFIQRQRLEPVFFIEKVLGRELWSKQREVAEAVRQHSRVAVRACHGPGKTFVAAAIVLWFLRQPEARVVTTAPTWRQVKSLLWHEINLLHNRAAMPLGGICLQHELRLPDGRYAIGLSTKPEDPEAFQGHHAKNILLVYDEASGIEQPIFDAGEGYLTTAGAKMLMIGNPTQASGEFYDAFHRNRAAYHQIHISYKDLPAFTGEAVSAAVADHLTGREWVEAQKRRYGENSPAYAVKVLGDFSEESDDTVFSLKGVENAQARDLSEVVAPDDQRIIGCDVARFGSDKTVVSLREAMRVRINSVVNGHATTETTGSIVKLAKQVRDETPLAPLRIVVDDTGVGGGVTDQVREKLVDEKLVGDGIVVTAFNGAEQAIEPDQYPNARSEAWFRVSERIDEIDLHPEQDAEGAEDEDGADLGADLLAPKYKLDSSGRRVVEPKEATKKRLGRSPDHADSVLLCFVPESQEGVMLGVLR